MFTMSAKIAREIFRELARHVPFTMAGAVTGIALMMVFQALSSETALRIFYILHPIHVILSALVTASMYKLHQETIPGRKCSLWKLIVIGYAGSISIATLSDSVIPFLGEVLLSMPNRGIHLGFIEKWWLVNPLAVLGGVIAWYRPRTEYPHAGHVLLSTWASLFHIIMATVHAPGYLMYAVILVFLFFSVWIPCCLSDIVFPLLFVRERRR